MSSKIYYGCIGLAELSQYYVGDAQTSIKIMFSQRRAIMATSSRVGQTNCRPALPAPSGQPRLARQSST